MDAHAARLAQFVEWVGAHLRGDEKGEAQLFCDRLMQAFGHQGIKEAGGELEYRVKKEKGTSFADLLWRPRLLLEMKKRGEPLHKHYRQAFEYWLHLVPNRPHYVVLCNFDEFWIYDLNEQLSEPKDKVTLAELPARYTAFNFMFPQFREPLFNNDRVAVTRKAAAQVAQVFNLLIDPQRGPKIDRAQAQRFVLQCVVALFAEDIDLLPRGFFTELLAECNTPAKTFDLIGGLFRQMAAKAPAQGGRYQEVPYFNGGLFTVVEPVQLKTAELGLLKEAAAENWAKVEPPIFGTLFEGSMDEGERHAFGAHFTSEADIQKVVLPTIVRPWRERIARAETAKELQAARAELAAYRVLDPACGSGNFLYVAYRELKRLEADLMEKSAAKAKGNIAWERLVTTDHFFGLDITPFAVELAKVTLMLAKKLALDEQQERLKKAGTLSFEMEENALPLDNLDKNIRCDDALFCQWPAAHAIIGNPPYQSKNKMQQELTPAYVKKVRAQYPGVPGRADYCVYWFRRAHDELPEGGRAGLVGTNTIRQNYSREGGLDHIVASGGAITEAVSTQVWSGAAVVHVSIVNWIKGEQKGKKKLFFQKGDDLDSPWEVVEAEKINAALSEGHDVTSASRLVTNMTSRGCYQGQTPGHDGFLLDDETARAILKRHPGYKQVLLPFHTANELLRMPDMLPQRFIIDFSTESILEAKAFPEVFKIVKERVLPDRQKAADDEIARNAEILERNPKAKVNKHHHNFMQQWWVLGYPRGDMRLALAKLPRYVVCSRVTKRPIFAMVDTAISPGDSLQVFPFPDDYSFGLLQSGIHWAWFVSRCSTLKGDFRYTSDTVFDTFPWPQAPTLAQAKEVAAAAVALRSLRHDVMRKNSWSLRELYRTLEEPGKNPLRDAHDELDQAVRAAYGMKPKAEILAFLLALNQACAAKEAKGEPITPPGLPPCVADPKPFITADCITVE